MKLVLLGGSSLKNKVWIEQVEAKLKPHFETTQVLYYDHWTTGGEEMDFVKEGEKLEKMCGGLTGYAVFAKSAGSWLILKLAAEGKIKPQKIILVGPAWDWARNNGFDPVALAKRVQVPVLVIDKTADPAISFANLKQEVEGAKLMNFQLVEVPGDNHNYEDISGLGKMVREFLAK